MGDLCVSLSAVKPGFLPAAEALNRNGDDKVCKSENPRISDADFEAFVNTIRIHPAVEEKVTQIEIPEMIDIPESTAKIMKRGVTVGLFKQVMQGYEITGHNADELQAILDNPSQAGNALTFVSLLDAREFAKRLSEQTGRKFRVPTDAELLQAKEQLSGDNWTWTETEMDNGSGIYFLRPLDSAFQYNLNPEFRSDYNAVRLVEDK